eukprot:5118877-Pyramimonas_sp.AAC.3
MHRRSPAAKPMSSRRDARATQPPPTRPTPCNCAAAARAASPQAMSSTCAMLRVVRSRDASERPPRRLLRATRWSVGRRRVARSGEGARLLRRHRPRVRIGVARARRAQGRGEDVGRRMARLARGG